MAGNDGHLPVVTIPAELTTSEQVREFIHQTVTRRDFLGAVGVAGLGAVAFQFGCSSDPKKATPREIYVANAKGMVVANPVLCVGCRRCEAACVAYNEGKTQPSVSNVKVNRNLLWGVNGTADGSRGDGIFGTFRVVQDTCRQCPHPVPCQLACPNDAIEVVEPTNARVVNKDKCVGCGICVEACPWEMTSLDGPVMGALTKASKCHLCGGNPECVQACVSGALQYVPWTDRTDEVPERQVVPEGIALAPDVRNTCTQCH